MRLICAAVIEELQALLADSAFQQESETLFRHRGKPVLAAACGVGLVDFTGSFQVLLQNVKIDSALLTGTCGVYPESEAGRPIGTLVVPEKVSLGDLSEVEKSGYFPAPVVSSCRLAENLFVDYKAMAGGHCLTLATITANELTAGRIENYYQAHFEQMEAYAFARLCQLSRVRSAALFAVVNRVGSTGHKQWLANSGAGTAAAADLIRERFKLG